MENRPEIRYVNIIIWFLALANFAIHIYFSGNLEYHRDELLYFSLGRHPAAGYATVPPMIGWIAWLMQNLFGYSIFAVRFFPALMGGLMVFLVSAIARELGGSGYSRILAAAGIILAIFGLRTFLLFQPVHIDLMFWTLVFYVIIRYINTSRDSYLLLIGIVAGAAMLNKYLIGFLFASLLIIVPFTQYRGIFRNRNFWYGLLAGLAVFLPNLIWQISNGLPVINHFSELERTQLVNVDRGAFLFEQLVMPGVVSILSVAGLIISVCKQEGMEIQVSRDCGNKCNNYTYAPEGEELLYPGNIPVSDCCRRRVVGKYSEKNLVKDYHAGTAYIAFITCTPDWNTNIQNRRACRLLQKDQHGFRDGFCLPV